MLNVKMIHISEAMYSDDNWEWGSRQTKYSKKT